MVEFKPQFSQNSLPPQNIDAEEAILGGILLDPEAMGRVVNLINPEAFYIQAHKKIYEGAIYLYNQRKPTDLMTVTTWLLDRGFLEEVGGTTKLTQLVDRTVSAITIEHHAPLVMDKFLRRELIKAGHLIIKLGYDTTQEIESVMNSSQKAIFNLIQKRPQEGLIPISETVIDAFQEIEKLYNKTGNPGINTGFYDLDARTNGLGRSDLIIIAGRPSMGKTSFALNIAHHVALEEKLMVAIFSLEMSKQQLSVRLLSGETGIDSNKLRSGRITQMELDPLGAAVGALADLPIYINDNASLTVMQMRSDLRRLISDQKSDQRKELGLILLDYLQLMEGSSSDNRVQELSRITRALKGLARELNVPLIALSQLSRAVEQRNNKRPMLSDLRESGSIEQDADLVMMLYRDEYYNPDTPDRGIAEVIIAKQRNGPTGQIKLLFKPELTKFLNLEIPNNNY